MYRFREFLDAVERYYPEHDRDGGALGPGVRALVRAALAPGQPRRLIEPTRRSPTCATNAWAFTRRGRPALAARALTYRGVIMVKSPLDLALYTRLIWELEPATVLELGSLHGGSALWFSDQLYVLCAGRGEVHSFDLHPECVSPAARHPLVRFHKADLRYPARSFDAAMLGSLPHPWLVVDDAHVNVLGVFRLLDRFMIPGDYYVVEDLAKRASVESLAAMAREFEAAGYLVDRHYTDAFGLNVTSAPNAWLRKATPP